MPQSAQLLPPEVLDELLGYRPLLPAAVRPGEGAKPNQGPQHVGSGPYSSG